MPNSNSDRVSPTRAWNAASLSPAVAYAASRASRSRSTRGSTGSATRATGSATRKPHFASCILFSQYDNRANVPGDASSSSAVTTSNATKLRFRDAVTAGSCCRSDPAAALRAFANEFDDAADAAPPGCCCCCCCSSAAAWESSAAAGVEAPSSFCLFEALWSAANAASDMRTSPRTSSSVGSKPRPPETSVLKSMRSGTPLATVRALAVTSSPCLPSPRVAACFSLPVTS
mmetsp:Transcript_25980/g.103945  ORF Transcript_25980/g.103945 Transcript_25980/m.103945 type:complete len:231 (-) Transcript_25980:807-1499(-)